MVSQLQWLSNESGVGKLTVDMYGRRQNKVPIGEQLPNDFTTTLHGVKWLTNSPVERSDFTATFLKDFIILSRTRTQQLELGFPSMCAQVLPRPISQLNSYSLDTYFFFYLLVIGNSSTEEFKLYNSLNSLVLSIGYSYSAQFINYFVCWLSLLLGAAF